MTDLSRRGLILTMGAVVAATFVPSLIVEAKSPKYKISYYMVDPDAYYLSGWVAVYSRDASQD